MVLLRNYSVWANGNYFQSNKAVAFSSCHLSQIHTRCKSVGVATTYMRLPRRNRVLSLRHVLGTDSSQWLHLRPSVDAPLRLGDSQYLPHQLLISTNDRFRQADRNFITAKPILYDGVSLEGGWGRTAPALNFPSIFGGESHFYDLLRRYSSILVCPGNFHGPYPQINSQL